MKCVCHKSETWGFLVHRLKRRLFSSAWKKRFWCEFEKWWGNCWEHLQCSCISQVFGLSSKAVCCQSWKVAGKVFWDLIPRWFFCISSFGVLFLTTLSDAMKRKEIVMFQSPIRNDFGFHFKICVLPGCLVRHRKKTLKQAQKCWWFYIFAVQLIRIRL